MPNGTFLFDDSDPDLGPGQQMVFPQKGEPDGVFAYRNGFRTECPYPWLVVSQPGRKESCRPLDQVTKLECLTALFALTIAASVWGTVTDLVTGG